MMFDLMVSVTLLAPVIHVLIIEILATDSVLIFSDVLEPVSIDIWVLFSVISVIFSVTSPAAFPAPRPSVGLRTIAQGYPPPRLTATRLRATWSVVDGPRIMIIRSAVLTYPALAAWPTLVSTLASRLPRIVVTIVQSDGRVAAFPSCDYGKHLMMTVIDPADVLLFLRQICSIPNHLWGDLVIQIAPDIFPARRTHSILSLIHI